FKAAYSVDQFGAVHTIASRPLSSAPIWNWDIGRAITVLPNGDGGYILDGWGGVHAFGNAAAPQWSAYWPFWDIARGLAVLPGGGGGYVVDGWGGIHQFGSAPAVALGSYWPLRNPACSISAESVGTGNGGLEFNSDATAMPYGSAAMAPAPSPGL